MQRTTQQVQNYATSTGDGIPDYHLYTLEELGNKTFLNNRVKDVSYYVVIYYLQSAQKKTSLHQK